VKENFNEAVEMTFIFEGVHNIDTGGDTKYGIARLFHPEITDAQWAVFSKADAEVIYDKGYWNKLNCDSLPRPLDIIVFDTAVNPGPGECKILLSQCGGNISTLITLRENYYKHLAAVHPDKFGKDLKGWLNRCETIRKRYCGGQNAS